MTTQASKDQSSGENTQPPSRDDHANYNDEERALHPGISRATHSLRGNIGQDGRPSTAAETAQDETELQTRTPTTPTDASFVKRKTSELFEAILTAGSGAASQKTSPTLTPRLASLVEAYAVSDIAKAVHEGIEEAQRRGRGGEQLDMDEQDRNQHSRRGASWPTQFRILSGRAFKNLYRDPALLSTHYLSSIGLASKYSPRFLRSSSPFGHPFVEQYYSLNIPFLRWFACGADSIACGVFSHSDLRILLSQCAVSQDERHSKGHLIADEFDCRNDIAGFQNRLGTKLSSPVLDI